MLKDPSIDQNKLKNKFGVNYTRALQLRGLDVNMQRIGSHEEQKLQEQLQLSWKDELD